MNTGKRHGVARSVLIALLLSLLAGCAVWVGGRGNNGHVGIRFYESFRIDYGNWGLNYHIAPYRSGDRHTWPGGGHSTPHSYRPAPGTHSLPSLPSRSRSH